MPQLLKRVLRYRLLAISALFILLADQLTKLIVIEKIQFGTYEYPIAVIDGFLYWVHIGNTGAAWGMFQGFGFVLAIFAVATIAAILLFRKMLSLHLPNMQFAFGLLIGGILGNLIDRLLRGHVVDFIDVHLPFYRWPAFNIADSSIFVGVFLYLILSFQIEASRAKSQNSQKKASN